MIEKDNIMATINYPVTLAPGVDITMIFDDVAMKMTGINYEHLGNINQVLRISLLSPYNRTFSVNAGTNRTNFNIPTSSRPTFFLDDKGAFQGITWIATLGQ